MAVTAPKARRFKRAASLESPNRLTQRISLVVTDSEWDRICDWGESDPMARSLNAQLRAVIMEAVDAGIRPSVAAGSAPTAAPSPDSKPKMSEPERVRAQRDFKKQIYAMLTPEQKARYVAMTPHAKRPWNAAARKALAAGNPLPELP